MFLRSRSILSHPPLHRNGCSHSRLSRSHPLCGWLWVNQKREVPNVGGIAMVIIRSFGIAETTSFFRIAVPSFYRLSRQSVANPFPPVTGGREIVYCSVCWILLFFISVLPFSLFSASPCVLFHSSIWDPLFLNGKFISVDGYERVPVFALCTEKNNAGRLRCPQHFLSSKTFLNPSFLLVVCRKKRLINSDGAWKLKKKVGRKKRPSQKGVLKKGL